MARMCLLVYQLDLENLYYSPYLLFLTISSRNGRHFVTHLPIELPTHPPPKSILLVQVRAINRQLASAEDGASVRDDLLSSLETDLLNFSSELVSVCVCVCVCVWSGGVICEMYKVQYLSFFLLVLPSL